MGQNSSPTFATAVFVTISVGSTVCLMSSFTGTKSCAWCLHDLLALATRMTAFGNILDLLQSSSNGYTDLQTLLQVLWAYTSVDCTPGAR